MPTLNLQVSASEDDAGESSTGVTNITGSGFLVDDANEWNGFRWRSVNIAAGSTITAATIEAAPRNSGDDEPDITIYGEANISPAVFAATNNNISGRSRTSASVDWANADLGADGATFFTSPDISAIIQEIIDLPSWPGNECIVLMWTLRSGASSTRDMNVWFYDGSTSLAAKLNITYTEPSARTSRLSLLGVG